MKKECVLYERECISCGECDVCDLDPKKVCDNCGKCIDFGNDYSTVDVDLITEDESVPKNYHYEGEPEDTEEEDFFDEDFEEDFGYADDLDFDDESDADGDDFEFDFGEFFGER